ncbi:CbiQ family ECF transporter T component [Propionibacteriaceae bacterium G1746]
MTRTAVLPGSATHPVAGPGSTVPGAGSPAAGTRPATRSTHPWAWWGWAVGAAICASFTANPLLLALVVAAVLLVTVLRRSDAPWARSVGAYITLALVVIGFRVVLTALLGGSREGLVLFTLPEANLPDWMAGIRFGGPVTLNAVLAAAYDGMRLAAIVICVGAANALANPRQALKSVPAALNQVSVAVVIALSVAPQLIESIGRVRRARRLRGGRSKGLGAVLAILVPVMEDALERSMRLATAMESRGYGRRLRAVPGALGAAVTALLLVGLLGMVGATYALFSIRGAEVWALVGMGVAAAMMLVGLHLSGRGQQISRYRPHPWHWQDTALVACGIAAAVVIGVIDATNSAVLFPRTTPLQWPPLTLGMVAAAVLLAAALLFSEPAAPTPAASTRATTDDEEPR